LHDIQALAGVLPHGGGRRMPSPPTAEERMRAPVLGGRSAPTREESIHAPSRARQAQPSTNTDGAGATLRSRMADGAPQRHTGASRASSLTNASEAGRPGRTGEGRDPSTRLDIRAKSPSPKPDSGSVEIPIHITGSDLHAVQGGAAPASAGGEYDEMPTEVFRPGKHIGLPARSPSATRIAQAPQAAAAARRSATPGQAPPPPPRQGSRQDQVTLQPQRAAGGSAAESRGPTPMAPVNLAGLVGDDWEGETVVKKPAALTTMRHRERPPPRERDPKPFNPDETMKLSGDVDVDVDFSDETQFHVPPRRPR
jgi:hypothetical protein